MNDRQYVIDWLQTDRHSCVRLSTQEQSLATLKIVLPLLRMLTKEG